MDNIEIERKFLVKKLPDNLESYPKKEILIIRKTRYIIPLQGCPDLKAELDIFKAELKGLIIVEVEFKDEKEANSFIAPDWFGRDVSLDKSYHNSNLSRNKKLPLS